MTQADVIIIGAGAAGLMAGRELIKAGKTVILLEARNRIGGRINQHTGAEFIHGNQPLTQALLNEAGIPYYAIPSPDFDIPHWSDFVQQLEMALSSLAAIFNMHNGTLQSLLTNASVTNWSEEPFTRGSYSYATIHTKTALPVLRAPVAGTLFFAGEGLYNGSLRGTVEAALASGKEVVKEMIQ